MCPGCEFPLPQYKFSEWQTEKEDASKEKTKNEMASLSEQRCLTTFSCSGTRVPNCPENKCGRKKIYIKCKLNCDKNTVFWTPRHRTKILHRKMVRKMLPQPSSQPNRGTRHHPAPWTGLPALNSEVSACRPGRGAVAGIATASSAASTSEASDPLSSV